MTEEIAATTFLDPFAEEVWKNTYKYHEDETVEDTHRRVAKAVASVEKTTELKEYWEKEFYFALQGFKLSPGGRILSNAGTDYAGTTLINCFVNPKLMEDCDSIEGIYGVLLQQAKTLKSEGGWGMNFSFIRPRGSLINKIGVESPGAVRFMELFDKSSDIITSGSGINNSKHKKKKGKIRKGAMMGILDCTHPDILEFITAKQTEGRLAKFNISVNILDELAEKIVKINDLKTSGASQAEIDKIDIWDLVFPEAGHPNYSEWDGDIQTWLEKGYEVEIYQTLKASEIWDAIMKNTYNRNDPGVFFGGRANSTSLINYLAGKKIKATNPCGEQALPFGGTCNLASLNLTQFYNPKTRDIDLDLLKRVVRIAVRFMDNINDLSNQPLPEYREFCQDFRRIGLGYMGWGSLLYMMKYRFGSDQAEVLKNRIQQAVGYTAIETSTELAEEKGAFKDFDADEVLKNKFWDFIDLPDNLKALIKKRGLRNSSLFSIQPTGNTGVMCNIISGGLEPVFLPEYTRTVIIPDCPDFLKELVPKYWLGEFVPNDTFKLIKEGTDDVLIAEVDGTVYKIDRNRGLTKEVLCMDYGTRYLKSIGEWDPSADWATTALNLTIDEHLRDFNTWCQWCDSACSKTVNVPSDYSFEDFQKLYLNAYKTGYIKGITTYRAGTMTSVLSAGTSLATEEIPMLAENHAPKRLDDLPADIFNLKIKGQRFIFAVGLLNDRPYEIFGGKCPDGLDIKSTTGTLTKEKVGKKAKYSLDIQGVKFSNFADNFTAEDQLIFRLTSQLLRHGVSIKHIVEQLEKANQEGVASLTAAVARTIRKYIEAGTETEATCDSCGEIKVIFQEGCYKCLNCGNSKCG